MEGERNEKKNEMKNRKEHFKFSFEKLKHKVSQKIEKMSDIDPDKFAYTCQLAGIDYGGKKRYSKEDLEQELTNYTYKRLNALRDEMEARQQELIGQIEDLGSKLTAIATSLDVINRAEERKLQKDIEKIKNSSAVGDELMEELKKDKIIGEIMNKGED